MFFLKWPLTIITLLLCFAIQTPALAQSIQAMQAKLVESKNQVNALEAKLKKLKSDSASVEAELSSSINKPSPELTNLNEAKIFLDEATKLYQSNPSADNKAKMSNSEFKFMLAKRKLKKSISQPSKLTAKRDTLTAQLITTTKKLESLKNTASKLRAAIKQKEKQQASQEKSIIEKKQRDSENEILRLKAELAWQKKLQAKKDAKLRELENQKIAAQQKKIQAKIVSSSNESAPGKPLTTPEKDSSTPPANKPRQPSPSAANKKATPNTPSHQTIITTTTVKTKNKNTTVAKRTNNSKTALLSTISEVTAEEKRLNQLQLKRSKKRSRYNKIINIKSVKPDGSFSKSKANTLRSLGHKQYEAAIQLKDGDYVFAIGFHTWRESIPSKLANREFMFIYDESNNKKPRLVYYDKKLSAR